jgi:hypothetical protein
MKLGGGDMSQPTTDWFYATADRSVTGPVSLEELRRHLAANGQENVLVWNATLEGWKPASSIREVVGGLVGTSPVLPPPLPDTSPKAEIVAAAPSPDPALHTTRVQGVRAGIAQHERNDFGMGLVGFEAFLLAFVVGARENSIGAAIIAFVVIALVLNALSQVPAISQAFSYLAGVIWGGCGYAIARTFEAESVTVWAITIFAAMIGLTAHLAAFQNLRDLSR